MKSVPRKQSYGQRQEPEHLQRTQRMLAEYLQHIRQQCDTGAEEDQSHGIQRMGIILAKIRQVQVDEDQTCESDRDVEEENEAPVQITHDEASGDGPEHR